MTIPSVADCLALMERYRMPANIRAHSLRVGRVAGFLTEALAAKGEPLRVDLTVAGALLHDIAKGPCLNGRCRHAEEGAAICRQHGYDEVAGIVAEHVVLAQGFTGRCQEREIVYYADKRVRHDQLVSLEERRDDLIIRYGEGIPARQAQIRENFLLCRRLEEHLFARLAPLTPADLAAAIAAYQFPAEELPDAAPFS